MHSLRGTLRTESTAKNFTADSLAINRYTYLINFSIKWKDIKSKSF